MVGVGTILIVLAVLGVIFSLFVSGKNNLTKHETVGFFTMSFFAALMVLVCGILVLVL